MKMWYFRKYMSIYLYSKYTIFILMYITGYQQEMTRLKNVSSKFAVIEIVGFDVFPSIFMYIYIYILGTSPLYVIVMLKFMCLGSTFVKNAGEDKKGEGRNGEVNNTEKAELEELERERKRLQKENAERKKKLEQLKKKKKQPRKVYYYNYLHTYIITCIYIYIYILI